VLRSLTIAVCLLFPAFAGAPRNDAWKVIGPGGGGSIYAPAVSPHNTKDMLAYCDMTGAYISHDGGDSWRNFNLRGRVHFYLFDPVDANVIYVQTTGLWRSADKGNTWRLVYPDPASVTGIQMPDDHAGERFVLRGDPQGSVSALAVDPANSKLLYAAILDRGKNYFATSTDWGKTWKRDADLPGFEPRSAGALGGSRRIFIDPSSPKSNRTIYLIGTKSVSVRRGNAWRTLAPPPGVDSFLEYSGGFLKAGPVFYVTSQAGAFVSGDGGENWRPVSLPGLTGRLQFSGVGASFHHPEVAYLSFSNGRTAASPGFGFARTADAGRTWSVVWDQNGTGPERQREAWMVERNGAGWGRNTEDVGVAPTDPNLVYGSDSMRMLRSTDGGKSWEAVYSKRLQDGGYDSTGLDVTTAYGVHFDPFDKNRIFITYTDIGQFRSENGGKSWLISTIGVPRTWRNTTYWMEFDPEVKGRVWGVMSYVHDLPRPKMWNNRSVTTYVGGICRSDDGAKNWNCSSDWIPDTAPTHILLDARSPKNARVLYVAAFGKGVYKSVDGGDHWVLKNTGIRGTEPFAWRMVQDRNGALYLIVARRSSDGSIGNDGDGALYRSTDGAEHWTPVPLPQGVNGPNGLAVDGADPQRLYLAAWGRHTNDGAKDGGIFVSADAGATWRNVLARDQHVYDVTLDPRNPKLVYACGFESSAWRSTDRGATWSRIGGYNFKWGHRIVPDPYDAGKIYITTFGGSVWHGPAAGDPRAAEDIVTPQLRYQGREK
jgi:photosystem II stability/assembly factor-like uncharacterized protein